MFLTPFIYSKYTLDQGCPIEIVCGDRNIPYVHCPIPQPGDICGYWAFEMRPVRMEVCCNCQIHTRFPKLGVNKEWKIFWLHWVKYINKINFISFSLLFLTWLPGNFTLLTWLTLYFYWAAAVLESHGRWSGSGLACGWGCKPPWPSHSDVENKLGE